MMNVFWSAAPAGAPNKERTIPKLMMSTLRHFIVSSSLVLRTRAPFFCHSHSASCGGLGLLQEALYGPLTDAIEPIPPSDLADDNIPRPIDKVGGGQAKHPIGPCG